MAQEENDLHMAAIDALCGVVGRHDETALARLLRSDYALHPVIRRTFAEALENGQLRLVKGRRGKPVAVVEALERNAYRLKVGNFILNRITPTYPQKAAVADACDEFGISDRTAKIALKYARNWHVQLEAFREAKS